MEVSSCPNCSKPGFALVEERILFPSIRNGVAVNLEGIVSLPDITPRSGIVMCHPHPAGGGNMNVPLFLVLTSSLIPFGVVVMRFNFGGVGKSGGNFTNGREEIFDVGSAVDWLGSYTGLELEKIVVVGWSFGSLMALLASTKPERAGLTIAISPPIAVIDSEDLSKKLAAAPGSRFYVVGERDDLCPAESLFKFAEQVSGIDRENVCVIPGADHFLFGREKDVAEVVKKIIGTRGFLENPQSNL